MAVDLGPQPAALIIGVIAGVVAFALALLVMRAGLRTATNRRLVWLLVADGILALTNSAIAFRDAEDFTLARLGVGAVVLFDALALLAFLGTLETPLARPLRGKLAIVTLASVATIATSITLVGYARGTHPLGFGNVEGPNWLALGFTAIAALVISIAAFLRTDRRSAAHSRAKAAAVAFVARDALFVFNTGGWAAGALLGMAGLQFAAQVAGAVSILIFVALVTYGILRTQLFDIDLKVRWGIQKGTIAAVIIAAAFVGEKIAENYLSREYGWVVGSVVAGLLVFAAPRLNKLGEKVAKTAMPTVEPTVGYIQFKKLEVYKAAVESAQETGGVDERQRLILDKLRGKLGLTAADASAIEAELAA